METKALIEVLQGHPFLHGLEPGDIPKLAELAEEVQFSRDQIVFRQGDESGLFYVILSGRVALEASAPGRILRIETASEGDELGWSSVLGEGGKVFQARALEPVEALMFDGGRLRQACDADPAFGYRFLFKLLRVVARRLQATRVQLLDLYKPVYGGSKLL